MYSLLYHLIGVFVFQESVYGLALILKQDGIQNNGSAIVLQSPQETLEKML